MVIEMYFQAVIRAEHLQHNASLQEKMLGMSKQYVLSRLVPSQQSCPRPIVALPYSLAERWLHVRAMGMVQRICSVITASLAALRIPFIRAKT